MTELSLAFDSLQAHDIAVGWTHRLRRRSQFGVAVVRSQINLYYFWEKRWFFIAMAIGAAMLSMPLPEGLSREAMIVLTMSTVATILFITEPIPIPTVALLIIVGQVVMLELDSTVVARSLMTDSVLFIMGSLIARGRSRKTEAR